MVRVRITEKPREDELDGLRLDGFVRGTVRDVSPLIGAWLITEGYADLELRMAQEGDQEIEQVTSFPRAQPDRRRRVERRRSQD
jgi:hypothetical protein